MKNSEMKNVRIYAENRGKEPGFEIYVEISGKSEHLMHCRHNGLLYPVLKDGMARDELERFGFRSPKGKGCRRNRNRRNQTKLYDSVANVSRALDRYLTEFVAA